MEFLDIFLAVLGVILILLGFIGSVLPVIPGPPISWSGYLLLIWTKHSWDLKAMQDVLGFESTEAVKEAIKSGEEIQPIIDSGYKTALWILLGVVVAVTVFDYVVPIIGTKKYGGSKRGQWGATIGVIVGMIAGGIIGFGPWGALIGAIAGPFLGAYLGELTLKKTKREALRSAWGSFIGFLLGAGVKMTTCMIILVVFWIHLGFDL